MELPSLVRSPTSDGCGGMNLRKVTVLSKDQWEGMQYRLNKRQIEAEKIRKAQEENQRLHDLSVERAKNWPNTIYVSEAQLYICDTAPHSAARLCCIVAHVRFTALWDGRDDVTYS